MIIDLIWNCSLRRNGSRFTTAAVSCITQQKSAYHMCQLAKQLIEIRHRRRFKDSQATLEGSKCEQQVKSIVKLLYSAPESWPDSSPT